MTWIELRHLRWNTITWSIDHGVIRKKINLTAIGRVIRYIVNEK